MIANPAHLPPPPPVTRGCRPARRKQPRPPLPLPPPPRTCRGGVRSHRVKSSSVGSFPFLKPASFFGVGHLWSTAFIAGLWEPVSLLGEHAWTPGTGVMRSSKNITNLGGEAGEGVSCFVYLFCFGYVAAAVTGGSTSRRGSRGCRRGGRGSEGCAHPPSAPPSRALPLRLRTRTGVEKRGSNCSPRPWRGSLPPADERTAWRSRCSQLQRGTRRLRVFFFFFLNASLKDIPSRISILRFSYRVCITTAWQPPSLTLR